MTVAAALDELAKAANLIRDHSISAASILSGIETLEAAAATNAVAQKIAAIRQLTNPLAAPLRPEYIRRVIDPFYRDAALQAGYTDRGLALNALAVRDYMQANSLSVLAVSTGAYTYSQIQDEVLVIVEHDEHGNVIVPEIGNYNFICSESTSGGAQHEPVFDIKDVDPGLFPIEFLGRGYRTEQIRVVSEASDLNLLQNPSYTLFNDTAPTAGTPTTPSAVTSWPGWVASGTGIQASADNTSRDYNGQTNQKSIIMAGNESMTQYLTGPRATRRVQFQEGGCYMPAFRYYLPASRTGTLTLRLGSQTQVINLSGKAATTHHIAYFTSGSKLYFENFDQEEITFAIECGSVSDEIHVDDCTLELVPVIDNNPICILGGQDEIVKGDETGADGFPNVPTRVIVQDWANVRARMSELVGRPFVLPYDASPTVTDNQ